MTDQIQDFETENLIATQKFRLTNWTLSQYESYLALMQSQKACVAQTCMHLTSLDSFQKCLYNCEAGQREVLRMQQKHAEVARLTYAKNIARCEQIHGTPSEEAYGAGELEAVAFAHCLMHNTDKVDRRFFGYYSSKREGLVGKFAFP